MIVLFRITWLKFIPQPVIDGQGRSDFPLVLEVDAGGMAAEVRNHLPQLALGVADIAQDEIGHGLLRHRSDACVGCICSAEGKAAPRNVISGEIKSRPNIFPAELEAMLALVPREVVRRLNQCVPVGVRTIGRIADAGELAHGEERNAIKQRDVGERRDLELSHDIPGGIEGMEISVYRLDPADAELEFVHLVRADHQGVSQHALMRDRGVHGTLLGNVRGDVLRLIAVAVTELEPRFRALGPIDARQRLIVVRAGVFIAEEIIGVATGDVVRQGHVVEQRRRNRRDAVARNHVSRKGIHGHNPRSIGR